MTVLGELGDFLHGSEVNTAVLFVCSCSWTCTGDMVT